MKRIKWLYYWHVQRQVRKFIPWLATKLPANLKYFVVVNGMCEVEPLRNPSDVTGMQLLDHWTKPVKIGS